MKDVKRKKTITILICVILCIFVFLFVFWSLLSWNSSYSAAVNKISTPLIDKVRQAQKEGATIELNDTELNQIISMYFKEEKSYHGITVKGIRSSITNNNIMLYIPINYKGLNFLVTSEGGLDYKDGKIEYKCLYIKVGKVKLPKDMVIKKLQAYLGKTITIENNNILIDKNIVPLEINSIEIKDNKVLLGLKKVTGNLEEKLKSFKDNTKEAASDTQIKDKSISIDTNNSSTSGTNSSTSQNTKDISEMDAALDRISGGLSSAMGAVSTGGQKAVISEMISVIGSMKGNPNANPYNYAGSVRAVYNKLSPKEKAELKSAVFSNINGADVNIVSKMLSK